MTTVRQTRQSKARHRCARSGMATLDYVLVLGAALPITGAVFYLGSKIMRLAYEMITVLISWPFM